MAYSPTNYVTGKPRKLWSAEHLRQVKQGCQNCLEKNLEKLIHGIKRWTWADNSKISIRDTVFKNVNRIYVAQYGVHCGIL
jgi:hypothetical protein